MQFSWFLRWAKKQRLNLEAIQKGIMTIIQRIWKIFAYRCYSGACDKWSNSHKLWRAILKIWWGVRYYGKVQICLICYTLYMCTCLYTVYACIWTHTHINIYVCVYPKPMCSGINCNGLRNLGRSCSVKGTLNTSLAYITTYESIKRHQTTLWIRTFMYPWPYCHPHLWLPSIQ